MNEAKSATVNCPSCRTPVLWCDQSPQRPFCSERCKDTDFIAWAREELRIAGSPEYAGIASELPDGFD